MNVLEGRVSCGGQEHIYMETQSTIALPGENDEWLRCYLSAFCLTQLSLVTGISRANCQRAYSDSHFNGGGFHLFRN